MIEVIVEEVLYALALSDNLGIEITTISIELPEKLTIEVK
jgi:hypothetical protein